jgi:hypothetical protein
MDAEYAKVVAQAHRVWEGPHRTLGGFRVIQIGWWLEPEEQFVPHWLPLHITGSATPVYVEEDMD